MKILHSLFTNDVGGTERHVADLASAQSDAGHEVSVMIRGDRRKGFRDDAFREWVDGSVNIVCLPDWWGFIKWPLLPIWWKLRQLRPDIIHTHHGRDSRYLSKLAGKTPVIASLHMRYREKDYKRHDGLICVSNWQLKTIPQKFRKDTVLIPNWVRRFDYKKAPTRTALRKRLKLPNNILLFGSVGRLSPEKAPDDLIEAFLLADIPNSHLVVFGSGELEAALKKQVRGHKDKITLMGYEKNIRPWYKAFDVFVLPSREESFGLVLLEAMDAGCPIVATRTAGAKDLLNDNEAVVMAETASAISLAHALNRMAESPRKQMKYPELSMHRLAQANTAILSFYSRFLDK